MTSQLRLALCVCAALVIAPWSAMAQITFDYTQTDATTGSGTLTGSLDALTPTGTSTISLNGAMPAATVVQNDPLGAFSVPAGTVGFIVNNSAAAPGSNTGVHVGFSGSSTVSGSSGPGTVSVDVPLIFQNGSPFTYSYDAFDNPAENDITGSTQFRAWLGDNTSGHRHTGNTVNFVAGLDNHTGTAGTNLGGDANGDSIGITAGLASNTGPIFVDSLNFTGSTNGLDLSTLSSMGAEDFNITIDFGPEGQRVQAGHIGAPDPSAAATPNNNTNGTDVSGIVIGSGTGAVFTLGINDTDQGGGDVGGIDWRDRGNSTNGADNLVMLGEDFIKNNAGIVRLDFGILPEGDYDITSFHLDPGFDQSEEISVFVDVGSGFVDTGADGNADFSIGGVNNLDEADILGTIAEFSFSADGLSPVSIVFDGTGAGDTEVPLNGLQIQFSAIVPEPTSIALWSLLGGLGLLGYRRLRRRRAG